MKGFKEFKARMESDVAFREKFRDVKDEAQLLALTRAEGYDIGILDEEDLDVVAGGRGIGREKTGILPKAADKVGNAVGNAKKDIVIGSSVTKVVIGTAADNIGTIANSVKSDVGIGASVAKTAVASAWVYVRSLFN